CERAKPLGKLCTRSRQSRSKAQRANLSESGATFRSLASRERERRRASKRRDAFRAREPFGSGETLCRASLVLRAPVGRANRRVGDLERRRIQRSDRFIETGISDATIAPIPRRDLDFNELFWKRLEFGSSHQHFETGLQTVAIDDKPSRESDR